MCKVLVIAGIKPRNVKKAWKFIERMAKPMSQGNSDGLGYSAITADGQLFGERWLTNSDAFTTPGMEVVDLDQPLFDNLGGAIDGNKKPMTTRGEYNSFGEINKDKIVAITMHTRMATTPKGMMNTHPFVDQGISLIHNGVIRNADDIGLKMSTCDSEAILRQYIDHDVKSNPENFSIVAGNLQGYYACGVLTNTETGPILDVFKGNHASLYACYIQELETYVLSTSDTNIKDVCKDLGFSYGETYRILEGKFIRIDAVTHRNISITDFKVGGTGYSSYGSGYGNYSNTSGTTGNLPAKTQSNTEEKSAQVYPFKNNRKNTEISDEMMKYFKAGTPTCEKLTDREAQEFIMGYDKQSGGY